MRMVITALASPVLRYYYTPPWPLRYQWRGDWYFVHRIAHNKLFADSPPPWKMFLPAETRIKELYEELAPKFRLAELSEPRGGACGDCGGGPLPAQSWRPRRRRSVPNCRHLQLSTEY